MVKNSIAFTGAAALVALSGITGIAFLVSADEPSALNPDLRGSRHERRWESLTDEQKAELESAREQRRTEAEARREEMDDAIAAGYEAFVQAAGEDSPLLEKVNQENFAVFQEAHSLMEQAREKLQSIGLERGFGRGGQAKLGRQGGFGPKPGCPLFEAQ